MLNNFMAELLLLFANDSHVVCWVLKSR